VKGSAVDRDGHSVVLIEVVQTTMGGATTMAETVSMTLADPFTLLRGLYPSDGGAR
jgi:hypothetical protein